MFGKDSAVFHENGLDPGKALGVDAIGFGDPAIVFGHAAIGFCHAGYESRLSLIQSCLILQQRGHRLFQASVSVVFRAGHCASPETTPILPPTVGGNHAGGNHACGQTPTQGEVSGVVMVDGKPAATGAIAFIPVDGKSPTAGAEIKDGKYTAKVPFGTAKVEVRVPKVVDKRKLYDTPDSPWQPVMVEVLPPKYNDESELRFEVKPGMNQKDWNLKSK